jgi:hypothetical protein
MMEAERTSETSANNYFTRQYIPEDKSEIRSLNELPRWQHGRSAIAVRTILSRSSMCERQ